MTLSVVQHNLAIHGNSVPGSVTITSTPTVGNLLITLKSDAIPIVLAMVHEKAKIRVDEGKHWNVLWEYFDDVKSVNHDKEGYVVNGVHTNWVESFNSRVRRAEIGIHHHIAGPHLQHYADEMAWREDHRRVSNGAQFTLLLSTLARGPASRRWKGYWQRGPSFQRKRA